MSERKVLNKYYPPDFDPSKITRLRLEKSRQYTVRIMAPCNMRCNTCHDYIARGKKFNARKETVDGEEYLGLKIFRFYFKCPVCMQEITYKTDPKSFDYVVESGATPNFKALKLAHQQAQEEEKAKEEEEKLNPMKMLENRTKASRREMENLEALEDLREINLRTVVVSHEELLQKKQTDFEQQLKRQEEEDEAFVQSIFGSKAGSTSTEESSSKPKSTNPKLSVISEDDEAWEEEEIEEEIGGIEDLYPTLKAEILSSTFVKERPQDASKQTDEKSNSKNLSSSTVKQNLRLNHGIIIKKRPLPSTQSKDNDEPIKSKSTKIEPVSTNSDSPAKATGLGLLTSYSDSDDSE